MLHCQCPPNSVQVHRPACPHFARPCTVNPVDQMQVVRICMADNITCPGPFTVRRCCNCGCNYRCGNGRWLQCLTRTGMLREVRELEVLARLPHYDYSSEASEVVAGDICDIKAGLKESSCAVNYCSTDCYYSSLCTGTALSW